MSSTLSTNRSDVEMGSTNIPETDLVRSLTAKGLQFILSYLPSPPVCCVSQPGQHSTAVPSALGAFLTSSLRWIWTRFCSKNCLSVLSSTRLALSSCKNACCSFWEIILARTYSPSSLMSYEIPPRRHCPRCAAPACKIYY